MNTRRQPRYASGRANWVLLTFLAIVAFFLLTEHQAHVLGVLPWLLLAACPLMHLFMHHGHHDHESHGDAGGSSANQSPGERR
jgi:hypothetical protein